MHKSSVKVAYSGAPMFTHYFRRLEYLFVIFSLAAPAAVHGGPRDVVDHIATLIENNYFEVGKAGDIARGLRGAASSGRFDRLKDPRDLAATLTSRLQRTASAAESAAYTSLLVHQRFIPG